jgi:hypothetical protein
VRGNSKYDLLEVDNVELQSNIPNGAAAIISDPIVSEEIIIVHPTESDNTVEIVKDWT